MAIKQNLNLKKNLKQKPGITTNDLFHGIISKKQREISKGISLLESKREEDQQKSIELLEKLWSYAIKHPAFLVGISGAPGVGKSSFINQLAKRYLHQYPNHRVAILAIDPASSIHGGSLLADKTRMASILCDERVFIRPTSDGANSFGGGITVETVDILTLLEAASFDLVLVEGVGVGQSQISIAQAVDKLILLHQPESGDDLQAMKKGLNEWIDILVVHKSDGVLKSSAQEAMNFFKSHDARSSYALSSIEPHTKDWDQFLQNEMNMDPKKVQTEAKMKKRDQQRIFWLEEKLKAHAYMILRKTIGMNAFDSKLNAYKNLALQRTSAVRVLAMALQEQLCSKSM